jgi:hypothetical protein
MAASTPAVKHAKGYFRPAIMKYFEDRPGVNVYVDDLAKEAQASREQVQSCISNMKREVPEFVIEVVVHGNVWRYVGHPKPAAKPGKRMFEELAVTKAGDILIQDQDGAVYKAVEL